MHQRCQDQTDTIAYRAVRRDRAPQTSDAAADASRAVTIYGVAAVLLLVGYCAAAVFFWRNQDFGGSGPLAETNPALTAPLPGAPDLKTALERCYPRGERFGDDTYKIVGGSVGGRPYYACYHVSGSSGQVTGVRVIGADGLQTS